MEQVKIRNPRVGNPGAIGEVGYEYYPNVWLMKSFLAARISPDPSLGTKPRRKSPRISCV